MCYIIIYYLNTLNFLPNIEGFSSIPMFFLAKNMSNSKTVDVI